MDPRYKQREDDWPAIPMTPRSAWGQWVYADRGRAATPQFNSSGGMKGPFSDVLDSEGKYSRPSTPRRTLASVTGRGLIREPHTGSDEDSVLETAIPYRADAGYGPFGVGPCQMPSLSPCESALHKGRTGWWRPEIPEAAASQERLELDRFRLSRRYQQPINHGTRFDVASCRYHIRLPESPNHKIYCRPDRSATRHSLKEETDSLQGGGARQEMKRGSKIEEEHQPKQRVAYNIQRLENWFKLMDYNSTGEVTVRKLIVGMLKHQELLDLFYLLKDGGGKNVWEVSANARPRVGNLKKEDMEWVREILHELDADGNASMEWPEFVNFFRTTGLLVEYETRKDLNKSEMGETDLAVYLAKQEEAKRAEQAKFFDKERRGGRVQEQSKQYYRKSVNDSNLEERAGCEAAQTT